MTCSMVLSFELCQEIPHYKSMQFFHLFASLICSEVSYQLKDSDAVQLRHNALVVIAIDSVNVRS